MIIWKAIEGYEGQYEVSNEGAVRSLDRVENFMNSKRIRKGKLKQPKVCGANYMQVELSKNGVKKHPLVHRLVAAAFIPNPHNYPVVNHKDCNPQNNHVDNLDWCTQKQNIGQVVALDRHVKGLTHGMSKLNEDAIRMIRSQTSGIQKLAEIYDVSYSTIKRVRSGRLWKHVS